MGETGDTHTHTIKIAWVTRRHTICLCFWLKLLESATEFLLRSSTDFLGHSNFLGQRKMFAEMISALNQRTLFCITCTSLPAPASQHLPRRCSFSLSWPLLTERLGEAVARWARSARRKAGRRWAWRMIIPTAKVTVTGVSSATF